MRSAISLAKNLGPARRLASAALVCLAVTGCSGREPAASSTARQAPAQTPAQPQAAPDSLGLALGALRAGQAQPPAETQEPELAAIPRITVDQLAEVINAGQAVVIDVRDDEQFEAAHIPGAAHIALKDIEAQATRLPKDKLIALYCT